MGPRRRVSRSPGPGKGPIPRNFSWALPGRPASDIGRISQGGAMMRSAIMRSNLLVCLLRQLWDCLAGASRAGPAPCQPCCCAPFGPSAHSAADQIGEFRSQGSFIDSTSCSRGPEASRQNRQVLLAAPRQARPPCSLARLRSVTTVSSVISCPTAWPLCPLRLHP